MKDESQQQVPPYEWRHFSGVGEIVEFANKNSATIISISNDDRNNWWVVYTKLPPPPPSQQDRSVSQPGKEDKIYSQSEMDAAIYNVTELAEFCKNKEFEQYRQQLENLTKENYNLKKSQPSQPGDGKDWLIEKMNLKASVSSLENTIVIKNEYIMELKAELTALKSRPSEGGIWITEEELKEKLATAHKEGYEECRDEECEND